MIELPDFSALRATATSLPPTRAALDRLDHVLFVAPQSEHGALARVPYGKSLVTLLARARKNGDEFSSSRAPNARGTGLTAGAFKAAHGFAALSWAAKAIHESLRDKPRSLGIVLAGLAEADETAAAESLLAAAGAAAFALPAFTSNPARLLRLTQKGDVAAGKDADLVILDERGAARTVLARGEIHVQDGTAVQRGTFE